MREIADCFLEEMGIIDDALAAGAGTGAGAHLKKEETSTKDGDKDDKDNKDDKVEERNLRCLLAFLACASCLDVSKV
jgi:hypothetical protein